VPTHEQDSSYAVAGIRAEADALQLPPSLANLGRNGGQPLPGRLRHKMESVFGADFSDVRIHVGPEAESIGALAFAFGSRIYIASGHYHPSTPQCQQLLGHELTHVMQQRAGRVRNPFGSGVALVRSQALEDEADRMSAVFAAGPARGRSDHLLRPLAGALPVHSADAANADHRVIQPLVMHGPLAAGGFGPMPVGEIRDWIQGKTTRVVPIGNTNTCANYIVGWVPPGGGGTVLTLEGHPVFHISSGILAGNNGCTVFFTNPQADHVKIVGVGWHHNGSATRYHLDWGVGKGPWHANRVICTMHGPHCAANH
jgi:hypothetical protein